MDIAKLIVCTLSMSWILIPVKSVAKAKVIEHHGKYAPVCTYVIIFYF